MNYRIELWRCRSRIFLLETSLLGHRVRQWALGWTAAQGSRFFRGLATGLFIALIILALTGAITRPWERELLNEANVEVARKFGYSSCCMDVMSIIGHGGGLDEIMAFARAKGETEFSPLVSPTNFYPEASADEALVRARRLRVAVNP